MDSTTTSAPRTEPAPRRARAAGFSLGEVLIASTLSAFVLAAVMSAFLFLGRTGLRAQDLSEMEGQVRRGLETFAQDARLAENLRWHSAQSVTFTLPAGSPATEVTYTYDADPRSATYRSFYRVEGGPASAAPRRVLVRDLATDFTFQRYKLELPGGGDNTAANDLETKQLQIVFRAERTHSITAGASQGAASARYILRNKRVSN